MKRTISNFKYEGGAKNIATIDVQTGMLFWKKKISALIVKTDYGSWFYANSGEYVGYEDVEAIIRVEKANALMSEYLSDKGAK